MEYLVVFPGKNVYQPFRTTEFESVAQLLHKDVEWVQNKRPDSNDEDCIVGCTKLPDDDTACRIMHRSVLTKMMIELWSKSDSLEGLVQSLKTSQQTEARLNKCLELDNTIAFRVEIYGEKISHDQQLEMISQFEFLLRGTETIDLKSPGTVLIIFKRTPRLRGRDKANGGPEFYFGRLVSKRGPDNNYWSPFSLQYRPVLGPTTLDTELSFIMVNQAKVSDGMIVFDPFVGTGGILVAASYFKAICFGTDIDIRVLKGYGTTYRNPFIKRNKKLKNNFIAVNVSKDILLYEHTSGNPRTDNVQLINSSDKCSDSHNKVPIKCHDVFFNFDFYGLPRPEIIRFDFATNDASSIQKENDASRGDSCGASTIDKPHRKAFQFSPFGLPWVHAIITDPPYGIRAGARKSGSDGNGVKDLKIHDRSTYISKTVIYSGEEVIRDLLSFASKCLVDHGRLVFLLPVNIDTWQNDVSKFGDYKEFSLISASLQPLTLHTGRALITMEKLTRN